MNFNDSSSSIRVEFRYLFIHIETKTWFSSSSLDMYWDRWLKQKDDQLSVSKHTETRRGFWSNWCNYSSSIELHICISYVYWKLLWVSVVNRKNIKFQSRLEQFWINVRKSDTEFDRAWNAASVESEVSPGFGMVWHRQLIIFLLDSSVSIHV